MRAHKVICGIGEKASDFLLLGKASYGNYKLAKGIIRYPPSQSRQRVN